MSRSLSLILGCALAAYPMPGRANSQPMLIRVQKAMEGKDRAPKSNHNFPHLSRAMIMGALGSAIGGSLSFGAGFLAPRRLRSYAVSSRADLAGGGLLNGVIGAGLAAFTYSYLRDKKVKPYLAAPLSFTAGIVPLIASDLNKEWGKFLPGAKSYAALGALGTLAGIAFAEYLRPR